MGMLVSMHAAPRSQHSNNRPKRSTFSGPLSGHIYRYTTRLVPTFAVFALGMGLAHAGSVYWDTNGATTGSGAATGTWGTSTFWSTSSAGTSATTGTLPTNADDVFFSAGTNGSAGTLTVSGIKNARSITFDDPVAITLTGGTIDLGGATGTPGIYVTAAASNTVSSAITLDSAATALSFSNTSTGTLTISGAVTGAAASGMQTITLSNSNVTGSVVVSGNIADGAGGGKVAVVGNSSAGLTTLSGTNTYTGPTTISAGTLLFAKEVSLYNNVSANWTAANITVNSGGTAAFSVGGTGEFTTTDVTTLLTNLVSGSTAGFQAGSAIGFSTTNASGNFTVTNNIVDSTGTGGGSIGVTKLGAGILTLSGTNTYTGANTISGGAMLFTKRVSLYNANTANWTAANINVNSGGIAAFSVGGTGEFTTSDVTTLLANLSTVNNNGLKAGSSIGLSTTNASGGTFTVSNIIADSTGTGGGSIGVAKFGTNKLVLTGANTYTGVTLVTNGSVDVQNDQSAANGGWTVSDSGYPAASGSPTVNFLAGSTIVVASGKAVSLSTGDSSGQIMTINGAGTVTNNGTLSVGRQSAVNINNGGNWTQNGTMSIATNPTTFGTANMAVNTGGTFTYAGSSPITMNPSGNNTGTAILTLAGGTFVTGQGFINSNTTTTGTGVPTLTLSSGGTLRLSANITTLAKISGATGLPFTFNLGTGGGIIDTNGFSTTITQNLTNVSGQTGSLTKAGAGKLMLSGTNSTYTGATNVNGGTLVVSGSLNGTANVNVGSSGTLASGVTGSITTASAGNISVSGTLAPGDLGTVGTLTLAPGGAGTPGQLSFASDSTLALDISGTTSDQVAFASTGDWLLGSGNLSLSLSGLTAADYGNTFTVFHNVSTSGFALAGITGYDTTNYVANFTQSGSDYQLSFTAIPEPKSAVALLGGLGMLMIPRRRRRRA